MSKRRDQVSVALTANDISLAKEAVLLMMRALDDEFRSQQARDVAEFGDDDSSIIEMIQNNKRSDLIGLYNEFKWALDKFVDRSK